MNVLITGAAGNLGSLLARHLIAERDFRLRLMVHRHDVSAELRASAKVEVAHADLADPASLGPAVAGIDQIIHFAGVLFRANPQDFLPLTNTRYFRNLVDAARRAGVGRIALVSFPHVEGPTSFASPATGRLDGAPVSVHARTRLEEERYLFATVPEPISLRVGMVYGRGILMIDAARWLARRRLLGVWREPTPIHLISREDFCAACTAALEQPNARGIYHVGDEGQLTLQDFLDLACDQWRLPRPRRLPLWLIYTAAWCCERYAALTRSRSPLTRDFIDIGRVSYYGDTRRFRQELVTTLRYRTVRDGVATL